MIGRLISHYKIIKKLSEGGMGVLYLADDVNINRKAVLKFLPADVTNDPDINNRFKREAQAAGSLSHPNIVTIYDVGVHEDSQGDRRSFIAMEYIVGKTLRELINSDELTIEKITGITIQICEGLNEAHSKGIIHRDIKPENIIIDEKGKVKILDFGLAKVKGKTQLTKEGSTLGTVMYMSPEQIRNEKVDQRTDIWSVGVMLYEMITGRYPFKGEYEASLFYSIINDQPEPIARYKSGISEGFQRIIDKALDKEAGTRYQHIDEVLSDLKRISKDDELTKNKIRTRDRKLTRVLTFISAIVFAIILIFVAANYFLKPSKTIEPPKHRQLTFDGAISFHEDGWVWDLSQISPNGQFIAYVMNKGDKKVICIKDNSGGDAIEIFKGLISVYTLRWSPNGDEIFFSGKLDNFSESSYIIPKLGGKVQKIQPVYDACWSPDGNFLAGIWPPNSQILIIKRETGDHVKTLLLKGSFNWMVDIDWSSGGDKIVFLTYDDNKLINTIWTIRPDGTNQQKIFETKKNIYSPIWSPNGDYIYCLQSNETTRDLIKIRSASNISDQISKTVQAGLQAYGFSITRDNKNLCFTKYDVRSNLWKFSYNESKNLFEPKKLTEGTSLNKYPRISPDGNQVVFVRNNNIFKMTTNGDSIKQITFLNSPCNCPSWSPDGKKIAFSTGANLAKVLADGSDLRIFKNTIVGGYSTWESDLEIFYSKVGNQNFYLFNPITEEKKLLVPNDSIGWMSYPVISPDSRSLAVDWWNRKPSGIWIISLMDSSQKLIHKGDDIYPLKWSKDGKWIYAINCDKTPADIFRLSVTTGINNVMYTLPFDNSDPDGIDITSNGKLIVCALREINSDVWMIENFDPDVE